MEHRAEMVRALFAPWTAMPVEVRRWLLGAVAVVGLKLIGLLALVTELVTF